MKHRSFRVLFTAFAVFLLGFYTVFGSSAASEFASGSGTVDDPYVIENAEQLACLSKLVNGLGTYSRSYFVLANDITLNDESFTFDCDTGLVKVSDGTNLSYLGTGIKGDTSGSNTVFDTIASEVGAWYKSDTAKTKAPYSGTINKWTPIGSESKRFEGYFDGKGHSVSGLYVDVSSYGGLFGCASAEIENVRIENSYIHAGEFAGALAGSNLYRTTGCASNAIICSRGDNVGGMIGKGGSVRQCISYCTVWGAENVGGIAGYANVEGCCSVGKVYGDINVGGIVGNGRGCDNVNIADVFGSESVGGICGIVNYDSSKAALSTSYNVGSVYGERYVGGVLGRLVSGIVEDCYYLKGTATDSSSKLQNGIGTENGGSSRSDAIGVTTGLDESLIKLKESFVGFDFENVWTISSDGTPMPASLKVDTHTHTYDNACDSTCNTCGETRRTAHSYSDKWSTDKKAHWHECTVCLFKTDQENHKPGAAATENTPQLCTVCAYEIAPAQGHTHKFSNAWSSDGTGHWYACACGEKRSFSSHRYDNACDTVCNDCSWTRSTSHGYSSQWTYDIDGHWHECSACFAKKDYAKHTPNDSANENEIKLCTVCSYVISTPVGHTHNYSGEWSSDGTNHWRLCSCGDKTDVEKHTYTETKKYDDRVHWEECSVCHDPKASEIHVFDNLCDTTCNECSYTRKITHVYDGIWLSNESGHWQRCVLCKNGEDALPHTWDSGTVTKEPTVNEDGVRTYKCTDCAFERNETVSRLPAGNTQTTTDPIIHSSPETGEGVDKDVSDGVDNYLVLAIVLGITSTVLLAALIVLLIIIKKKR